ncbi:DUF4259 domain-containing protein [Thiospirochaeta perfilievii]|uniref:DUF4259 domain-containing protein n=1 Tax=Thiospirochaeta perfilievii TaxID=252967 RepID=A0A5C1QF14_9SPIO|nr:DUF4259 domain-containing protein [Thiospirochaeta perfilievii]QEN05226.1 DUF4259 domain-containing protein [Thiospirochaeta perfilievii]
MGTWDIGFFDNDMACDWENSIKDNRDLSYIESAIDHVLENTEDSLDIDISNKALAAAESLARLLGTSSGSSSYTEHIDKWAKEFSDSVDIKLINKTITALEMILSSNSELKQFWTLRGEYSKWESSIKDLENRLKTSYEK